MEEEISYLICAYFLTDLKVQCIKAPAESNIVRKLTFHISVKKSRFFFGTALLISCMVVEVMGALESYGYF